MATLDKVINYNASTDGMALPINIQRGNPVPLDNSSLYLSKDAAMAYAATDPTAYVGQIIVAIEDDIPKAYIIKDTNGTLEEIGSGGKAGINADAYLNVTKTGRVATLTATDPNGTTTVTVTDGKNGEDGFSPYINDDGYWVTKDGVSNLPVTGPKGDKGEAFQLKHVYDTIAQRDKDQTIEVGDMVVVKELNRLYIKTDTDWLEIGDFQSIPGEKGEKGETGAKGDKGDAGEDGYSPIVSNPKTVNGVTTYTISYKDSDDKIKTQEININSGYFPTIKRTQNDKEGEYSTVEFSYFDGNNQKTTTLNVFNGQSPYIEEKSDRINIYTDYAAAVIKDGMHSSEIINGVNGTIHEYNGGGYYTYWPATWSQKFTILKNDTLKLDSNDGYTTLVLNEGQVDEDGNSREKITQIYDGDTLTIDRNATNDGLTLIVNKGRVNADGVSMEQAPIDLYDGFSPELTITQLQGGLHRFTATKKDGTVQSVDINTGYTPTITYNKTDDRGIYDLTIDNNGQVQHIEVNEGYAPTVTVDKKNDVKYDVIIDDKNGKTTTTLSSATIEYSDKTNGRRTVTVNDGFNGERSFYVYDGEFAYDDEDLQNRVSELEKDPVTKTYVDEIFVEKKDGYSLVSDDDIAQITTNKSNISTLMGDGKGSVDTRIETAISKITSFEYKICDTLPSLADSKKGVVYLVKATDGSGNDNYFEYISIEVDGVSKWEMLGRSKVDLSNCVKNTDKATASKLGVVKVDDATIKVNSDGVISTASSPDGKTIKINSDNKEELVISAEKDNAIETKTDGIYVKKTSIATDKEVGSVKVDGTTITIDTDGTIHTKQKGAASKEQGNAIVEKSDGLYVATGSNSGYGAVKADGKTIDSDNGEISVMISKDKDNSLFVDSDGLNIAKSDSTKFGVIKVDGKTLEVDSEKGTTNVMLSSIKEVRRKQEIGVGETYEYSNNLRVDAPYKVDITPYIDATNPTSPSLTIVHENQRTGKTTTIKTLTSGSYSGTLPKETKVIITNNAGATSVLDILYTPVENIITSEKDGLMIDRYANLANTYTAGFVIPDNDTITVDGNGVITSTIGANSVSYRTRNLIQLIRTYESLSVLPTVGDGNLIYKIPIDIADPDTLYKEYIWDGDKYVDTGVIGEGNEDGIYIDEDDTVPIATYVDEGKVRPDGDTIILENPDDVNNGKILVNTEVIATQADVQDLNSTIDRMDMNSPMLVPYEEDELFELAWSLVQIDEKPEYTKEDLDAILDQINFSGGGGGSSTGGSELTANDVTRLWNEALGIGGGN